VKREEMILEKLPFPLKCALFDVEKERHAYRWGERKVCRSRCRRGLLRGLSWVRAENARDSRGRAEGGGAVE